MLHRVLMDIVQPRQIRTLVHQPRFPKIEPYLPSRRGVQPVHPAGGFDVQHSEHRAQARRVGGVRWGMGDEVIMVGKHRPRLDPPTVFFRHRQQAALQHAQTVCAPEVVELLIRRAGDEKRAARCKLMRRRVRPRRFRFGHGAKMPLVSDDGKREIFAVREKERQRTAALPDASRSRGQPDRAERPGVRRPSGACPRAAEANRTDFLKLFLAADADGWNTDGTAKVANHAK